MLTRVRYNLGRYNYEVNNKMSVYEKNIGDRLKEFRESMGLKLVPFSKLIAISHSSLSNIENNKSKPSSETFDSLCRNTNINVYWLLTGQGQMIRGPEVVLTDDALKIGEWDKNTGITTDRSDPYRWHGQSARTSLEARSKEQPRDGATILYKEENEDPEVADLISKTRQILTSGTDYSVSLAANIRSFHNAMTTEEHLHRMDNDVSSIKTLVKDLVDECREIKERLNKSDSNIRQEDPEEIRGEILKKRAV